MIKEWLERRRQRKRDTLYAAGFDMAAGTLLRGGTAEIEGMEADIQMTRDFDDYNPFDAGMEEAIDKWRKL